MIFRTQNTILFMKKYLIIFCCAALGTLVSCINNDIPYPNIKAEVIDIEVEGQKSFTVDVDNCMVSIVLDEEADMNAAKILKLKVTPDAQASINVNDRLDLSSQVQFSIDLYRRWEWSIVATRPVERNMQVKNQVGAAVIDVDALTVDIRVSKNQRLDEILVENLKLAAPSAVYTPDPSTVTDFTEPVTFEVECWGETKSWVVTITKAESTVNTGAAEAWGECAYLSGSILEGSPLLATFEYREAGTEQAWLSTPTVVEQGTIKAKITGLRAVTRYVYRAKLGAEYGDEMEFTTEDTPTISNLDMNTWTLKGKTWFPNATAANTFWATGNEGVTSALAGGKNSNTFPTDDAVEGQAACITTIAAPVVDLAAGSLFTGTFKLNIFKPLESPKFSQEYFGRPTKLSFWYKYTPKVIDIAKKYPEMIGTMDKCNIYIYIGNWEGEILAAQIKGEETEGLIAYGSFESDKQVDQYIKETITLKYLNKTERPTRIMIVATSSIGGNSYIGGVGSTLWVDDFALEFD